MEIKIKKLCYQDYNITTTLNTKNIIGITGEETSQILKLISLYLIGKGNIFYGEDKIKKENHSKFQRKNAYIEKEMTIIPYLNTVKEYMINFIKQNQLKIKNPDKKMQDSLKIIGLEQNYLKRNVVELSTSERKKIQIALNLLKNPENIFLEDPFLYLDMKEEKKLFFLLNRLKEKYHKTIIFNTNNANQLYKYSEYLLLIKNKQIILEGPTKEIYLKVDYLTKKGFEIPEIIKFTYLAKKRKKVKIDYHEDIRDIIKDIYKHV